MEAVAQGQLLVGIPFALAAGALSFASPCVLPLVPGYLGYVGGVDRTGERARLRVVLGAALFVLGFSVVFVLTFVVFAAAGYFLLRWQEVITRIAGVLVIALSAIPVYYAHRLTRDEGVTAAPAA